MNQNPIKRNSLRELRLPFGLAPFGRVFLINKLRLGSTQMNCGFLGSFAERLPNITEHFLFNQAVSAGRIMKNKMWSLKTSGTLRMAVAPYLPHRLFLKGNNGRT